MGKVKDSKDKLKPPKRKPASTGQIVSWLKQAGHDTAKADKIKSKDDLLKLHGAKDA